MFYRKLSTYLIKDNFFHKDLFNIYKESLNQHIKINDKLLTQHVKNKYFIMGCWFSITASGLGAWTYYIKEDIDKSFKFYKSENDKQFESINKCFESIDKRFEEIINILNNKK